MKTFVISLPRSADRRNRIKSHLDSLHWDFEFFDGFDALEHEKSDFEKYVDFEMAENHWKSMSKRLGTAACTISHVQIFQKIVNEKIPYAVIFEDDAVPSADAKNIIDNHKKYLPDDWQVFLLGWHCAWKHKYQKNAKIANTDYEIGKMYYISAGAYAYVVSYDGAYKLLNALSPITRDSDDVVGDAIYPQTNLYALFPPAVNHNDFNHSFIKDNDEKIPGFNETIFNGHHISTTIRFFAINHGWTEKTTIRVDKIYRILTLKFLKKMLKKIK